MKTIKEMWEEYTKTHQEEFKRYIPSVVESLRHSFFAGFNGCYNQVQGYTHFENSRWEQEMDNHLEE